MKNKNSVFENAGDEDQEDEIILEDIVVDKVSKKREKNQRALFTRRAVEDLLERKRFMRENNYLYEEEFDFVE